MQNKIDWKPGTMIYPLPALLISCDTTPDEYNIFTVAWSGTICTNPAMCYISVRPERYSYDIIKRNMELIYVKAHSGAEHVKDYKYCETSNIGKRYLQIDHLENQKDCCSDQDRKGRSLTDGPLDITDKHM